MSQTTGQRRDMSQVAAGITFRVASEPWEREAIARLNHRTFTAEIPQHTPTESGALVDRFDEENTYLVAFDGPNLVGMLALRDNRPFSLDLKLKDIDRFLPPHEAMCEVRLLVVDPAYRSGRVLLGLMDLLDQECRERGYDLALISGTVQQLKLYRRLGFRSFGPVVGDAAALFQPMYLTSERADLMARRFLDPGLNDTTVLEPSMMADPSVVNLLPGPVAVRREVSAAFASAAESHRARRFVAAMTGVKENLRALVGARHVAIIAGSGTLGNDAVAGQISLLGGHGLVLSNGEFGERLAGQAARHRLDHEVISFDWGQPFDWDAIDARLAASLETRWLWTPHCETSTGVLNDLNRLRDLAARHDVRLCLDCVSSVGMVPTDLHDVWMASTTSGKALCAYPGLAIVVSSEPFRSGEGCLPSVLDLGLHDRSNGVPFTLSSNVLAALDVALRLMVVPERFDAIAAAGSLLRDGLVARDIPVLAPADIGCPGVLTIPVSAGRDSSEVGDRLADEGILVSYQSGYLLRRNWIQLCLLGDERGWHPERLSRVVDHVAAALA